MANDNQAPEAAAANGRWIVQKWDEGRGVYADQLRTDSAVAADAGFRASKEHRIIDAKLNDVAVDYPRTEHSQPRGEAEYSMRSQFKMALHNEQRENAILAKGPAAVGVADLAASDAFVKASTPEDRRLASERHPQLAQAFALEASYAKLAQRIEGKTGQDAFVAKMRENIATDVAKGRPLVDVQVRDTTPARQPAQQQDRDHDRSR